jgi:hypothetical protein
MGGGSGTAGGSGALKGGMLPFISIGPLPGGMGGAGRGVPLGPVSSPTLGVALCATLGVALCADADGAASRVTSAAAASAAVRARSGHRFPRCSIANKCPFLGQRQEGREIQGSGVRRRRRRGWRARRARAGASSSPTSSATQRVAFACSRREGSRLRRPFIVSCSALSVSALGLR